MDFDYIIVGGGSAGCVLASRLSANPAHSVLLIEAGGSHHSLFTQIPFLTLFTLPYWLRNWHFSTEPQAGLGMRRGYQPRGKVLGGSSAINAMIYIRGQQEDYDGWAAQSSPDWAFQSVLPVFRGFEANRQIQNAWHGQTGELSVTDLNSPNPVSEKFVEAGVACGHPFNRDFNGPSQHGVGLYQVTQNAGRRHSAADAFLDPIQSRPNLTIMTNALALKILVKDKTARAVQLRHRGQTVEMRARKKIILSAGAIKSPQLLMLSGIGPPEELRQFNIPLVHALPGVGKNLQDHPDYVFCYQSKHKALPGFSLGGIFDLIGASREYRKTKTGLMSSNFAEAGGFIKSSPEISRPDLQLHFVTGIVDNHARRIHFHRGMSCHVCVLRPESRGRIGLKSANPRHDPLIDPNFLGEEADVELMLKGYKLTREIMEHDILAPYRSKEIYPASSDAEILARLRQRTDTVYHPLGSCRMGVDAHAVVDSRLHVYGIQNLMIADASIMPSILSGNTNAPCMMIGEKAAQYIQEEMG